MPQHKSCEKRMRSSAKQNAYNRAVKSSLKTTVRKFAAADADGGYANAGEFIADLETIVEITRQRRRS